MESIKRRFNLRLYLSGLLPLFIFAHFGHHVIGAMLRPMMPMISSDLGLDLAEAGWVMSAFAITNGVSQLPAGWLADRFGTRFIILISITGVAIAGFFIGFTNSFTMLVALLILSALLGGGYHPAAASALSASVPEEHRGRALGIHFVGGSSTMWVMPLIASRIAGAWGWRSPYLVMAVPTMILGIVIYILVGRYTQRIAAEESHHEETVTEIQTESPGVRWGQLLPFIALTVLSGTLVMSSSSYLSFYARDVLGVLETDIIMLMAIQPGVGALAAPLGGYLADRFGNMKIMIIISLLAVPLILSLRLISSVFALAVLMVCMGLVGTARMPTSESYIFSNAPQRHRATLLGIYYFSGTGVSGLLTPFIGSVIERYKLQYSDKLAFHYTYTITAIATAVVVAVCSFLIWINREKKTGPTRLQ